MDPTNLNRWQPQMLGVLRIVTALTFTSHGTMKLLGFPQGSPPPSGSLAWYGGFFELIGGILLALGLFTRPVAFVLSGVMAVAYFAVHAPQSFFPVLNGGDAAILYCFVFLYFIFAGPGAFSVDGARNRD